MACITPLVGWMSKSVSEKGKRAVVFTPAEGLAGRPVQVPCGQCIGCRLEYARGWAVRCMHEASMHDENCFITLTYDDEHLPEDGSLRKDHCQKFLKRLRSRNVGTRIRYYLSGEYGPDTVRPHYHALLFGFDFSDKRHWSSRDDYQVWSSDELEETWSHGLTEVGSATFESAAYCARYMVGKFKGKQDLKEKWYDGLEPEFALMSRGGKDSDGNRTFGIGYEYYKKHRTEIYQHDSVIIDGREQKPPTYYDRLFEVTSPLASAVLKGKRKGKAVMAANKDGRGDSKLYADKLIMEARVKLRKEMSNV